MDYEKLKDELNNREIRSVSSYSPCAILVPCVEIDGEIHLLYEQRASDLKFQPGEVCFPGGKIESGETPLECAIRETREEIGLSSENYEVLGPLNYIIHFVGFPVYPFLVRLMPGWRDAVALNPDEVAEIFTIPLSWLKNNEPYHSRMKQYTKALDPVPEEYRALIEDYPRERPLPMLFWPYESHLLWGMSAWITNWLLQWLEDNNLWNTL